MSIPEPAQKRYDWTEYEIGCYADASLGWNHVRNALADIIEEYNKTLAEYLRNPEVGGDDEDEALEILNHYTESGLVWVLDDEGLFLLKESK